MTSVLKPTKPTTNDVQKLLKVQEEMVKEISKVLESAKATKTSIRKYLKTEEHEESEDQESIEVNIVTEMNPFYIFLKYHTGQPDFPLSDLAKAFKILEETDYYSYQLLREGSYDQLFQVALELKN